MIRISDLVLISVNLEINMWAYYNIEIYPITTGEWNRENCFYLSENTLGITGNSNSAAVRGSHELLQLAQFCSVAGGVFCTPSAVHLSSGSLQFRQTMGNQPAMVWTPVSGSAAYGAVAINRGQDCSVPDYCGRHFGVLDL